MKITGRTAKMIPLLLFSVILSSTFGACEPTITVRVRNQTNETLQIFAGDKFIDKAAPGKEVKFETIAYNPEIKYPIIAKDEAGTVVYTQTFSLDDLKRNKGRVVIPTTKGSIEQSDNATGK